MLKLLILLTTSVLATYFYYSSEVVLLAVMNLCMSLWLFNKFKKNSVAIIPFFLLMFSIYSVLIGRVLLPYIAPTLSLVIDNSLDHLGLYVIWVFMIPLAYAKAYDPVTCGNFNGLYELAGLGLVFFGFVLCYFGLDTVSLQDNGRAHFSTVYEYSFVLFLLGCFFLSSSNSSIKLAVTIIIVSLALRDFYYGNRAAGLLFLLAVYVTLYRQYFTLPRFYTAAISGVLLMGAVGSVRYVLSGNFSLTGLFVVLYDGFFVFDTGLYAFVSGQTMISTAEMEGFDRISAITGLFANTLLGRGSGLDAYQIAAQFYTTIGGAWLAQMSYFYFGIFGVFCMSAYIKYLLGLSFDSSRLKQLIYFYVIVSSPRWLFYSVTPLFRGMLIIIIIYFIIDIVIKYLLTNRRNLSNEYF